MNSKIVGWKTKFLNQVGRITLARAFLNSIPNHVMPYITYPRKLSSHVDKAQRNFIWGSTDIKRKMYTVSRKEITKLKPLGGLGIQRNDIKNMTTHTALAWRLIIDPNSLQARILTGKNTNNIIRPEHFVSRN